MRPLSPTPVATEQAVLGILLFDSSCWSMAANQLRAADFCRRNHQLIFTAIAELANNNQDFDAVTIAEHVESQDQLQQCGGLEYLAKLAMETASTSNLETFVGIVREAARQRRIKLAAQRLIDADDFNAAMNQLLGAMGVAA